MGALMGGSYGSQVPADFTFAFGRVISSDVPTDSETGEKLGVIFHVEGPGGVDPTTGALSSEEEFSERDEQAEVYGALGIVSRPLPPVSLDPFSKAARSLHAEVVCVRSADGFVPIAVRDTRLRMGGNAPKQGTTALVGYGGAFVSFDLVDDTDPTKGNLLTAYVPYDFDANGVAQKAHAIIVDPTDDATNKPSISLVHANGQAIIMGTDEMIPGVQTDYILLKNASGTASLRLEEDPLTGLGKVVIAASSIICSGGVIVGDPVTATPLLPGVASQGSARFSLSP